MTSSQLAELYRDLITANHILHLHGVVDAFGHVSARHPTRHDVYFMAAENPPALVESPHDLVEYYILDSRPVDPKAAKGYVERFIHGEVYKRFPEVRCVVHSHSEDVLPYATSGVPLLPVYHMAGFLGKHSHDPNVANPFPSTATNQGHIISPPRPWSPRIRHRTTLRGRRPAKHAGE